MVDFDKRRINSAFVEIYHVVNCFWQAQNWIKMMLYYCLKTSKTSIFHTFYHKNVCKTLTISQITCSEIFWKMENWIQSLRWGIFTNGQRHSIYNTLYYLASHLTLITYLINLPIGKFWLTLLKFTKRWT